MPTTPRCAPRRARRPRSPSTAPRDGLRRRAAAIASIALATASLGAAAARGVAPARADDTVRAVSVAWRGVEFAGRSMTQLAGEVVNDGATAVGQVEVVARFRDRPGGMLLATGTTIALLPELAPGERSPFLLLVGPLEPTAVGHVDVALVVPGAEGVRERGLAVASIVTRTVAGVPAVFGRLVNAGPNTASASHTNVVAAIWDDGGLRELRAATMPIRYEPGTVVGQGHPPGVDYPWFMRLPEAPWTRLEWHVVARRYADGAWPVPLGIVDVRREDDGATPRFRGRIVHCGVRDAVDVAVVSSVLDGRGVVTFSLAAAVLAPPLRPGESRPLDLRWPGIAPDVDAAQVTLLALALDDQPLPPRQMPCRTAEFGGVRSWLPALRRGPVGAAVDGARGDR